MSGKDTKSFWIVQTFLQFAGYDILQVPQRFLILDGGSGQCPEVVVDPLHA